MNKWIAVAVLCVLSTLLYSQRSTFRKLLRNSFFAQQQLQNRALDHYGEDLWELAQQHELPWEYLMTLTLLECSGRRPCPSRFEPGVFKKLQEVRDGQRPRFEAVTQIDVVGASDDALRNLATSWGPFQVMGYHCIALSSRQETIRIEDLRGKDSLQHSVRWVRLNYGKLLQQQRYKDALHIHNTGKPYPKSGKPFTYDPHYIPNGIDHLEHFRELRERDGVAALR